MAKSKILVILGVLIISATLLIVLIGAQSPKNNTNDEFLKNKNRAKDSQIVASMAQARVVMVYVNSDNNNYDDFNCHFEDMVDICADIAKNGGKAEIVKDAPLNSRAACIYSKLNEKQNYWYCADSNGKAVFTEINPSGQGYCVEGKSASCPPGRE